MATLRVEGHGVSSTVMTRPQIHQAQADPTAHHLPYGVMEVMLPAIEAILRVRNLAEFLIIPLAVHMHAVSRQLLALVVPAMVVLVTAAYRLFLMSAAALRLAMTISRGMLSISKGILRYFSSMAATRQFQKKLEQELYSFLLGPGNALLKAAFWVAWWSMIGAFISAPWWFLTG
ncbi:hypothetical protein VUR80DRAFT_270 [Thermomyces stellatus]